MKRKIDIITIRDDHKFSSEQKAALKKIEETFIKSDCEITKTGNKKIIYIEIEDNN